MLTEQVRLEFFENGYGISVITGGYGNDEKPFEVAVLKGTEGKAAICYDTPITNDIIGFLSSYEVDTLATEIEALPCKDAPHPDATTFEEYIGKATSCVEMVELAFEWKTLPNYLRIEGD